MEEKRGRKEKQNWRKWIDILEKEYIETQERSWKRRRARRKKRQEKAVRELWEEGCMRKTNQDISGQYREVRE